MTATRSSSDNVLAGYGRVHYGDNLEVLRAAVADQSVDLVYLDPPFKSNQDYNVLTGVKPQPRPGAGVRAFGDTWTWSPAAEAAYAEVAAAGGPVATAMDALRRLTGEGDMLAYLAMMAPRLVELHRALHPAGSLYLHCDPTASHYLKLLLDAVFGAACFRNEVIWRYRRWPARSRQFQKMHDVLLFYSKSPGGAHYWKTLYGYEELAESTRKTFGTKRQIADFSSGHRKPNKLDVESPGPPLSDVWDISIIAPSGRERLGYPTQKPEALLERIILASSPEGGTVLDPFCGSGTSLIVAARNGRRFIGIDAAHVAVDLVRRRFRDALGEASVPEILSSEREPAEQRAQGEPREPREQNSG